MEETVGDETSEVFAADACMVDKSDAAEEEAPDIVGNEDDCDVGENATWGEALAEFCIVSLTPLTWKVFPCNTTGLEGSEDKDGLLTPVFCGEIPNPFMLPKDGTSWSPYLFFVVKVNPAPESPDKVLTGIGLDTEGDISGRVLVLVLGAILVLKVRVFDLGTVCIAPKDATLGVLVLSLASFCV